MLYNLSIKPFDTTMFYLYLVMILPSLLSLIIMPFTTIFVAKRLMKIESPKLVYKHQFINVFLCTLLSGILGSLFPYADIVVFVALFTFLSQRELKVSFLKAFGLALAGFLLMFFIGALFIFAFYTIVLTPISV